MIALQLQLQLQSYVLLMFMCAKSAARGSKRLFIIRHGQAQHNPRAEEARAEGCSHETFLRIMQEDDALDAELTSLGREQARRLALSNSVQEKLKCVDLVISSPLARALQTADLSWPMDLTKDTKRISLETFREINGWLKNAKRKSVDELKLIFKGWNFDDLNSNEDSLWTSELESESSCGERGYQGLLFLARNRHEKNIMIVSHGGLLRFTLVDHPLIKLECGRSCETQNTNPLRSIDSRFNNCEIREYEMICDDGDRPMITMREVTDFQDFVLPN